MKFTPLAIPGLMLIQPRLFEDERGAFHESFNARDFFVATGLAVDFVQDNHSVSRKGVLRGMHYQAAPYAQGKLVRVVRGSAFDVAVDIREDSPTFGKWAGVTLSSANRKQLWIPAGFAHGFQALEDGTEVLYKTTDFYDKASERVIRWDDAEIGVDWPIARPLLSARDQAGTPLWVGAQPLRAEWLLPSGTTIP